MWFYSFVFVVLALFNGIAYFKNFSLHAYIISLFFLILMAGLRPETCCADDATYISYYDDLPNIPYSFLEPTFFLISWISALLFNSYIGVFLIYSIIGVSIKGVAFFRLTKYYGLSLLLYYGSYFMLHEMTQIRVGVASGILLLSIPYIQEKRAFKFFTTLFIGFLFHYSLLIFSVFYFVDVNKINKYLYIGVIFTVFTATLLGVNILTVLQFIKLGFLSQKIEIYQSLHDQGLFGGISLINPLLFLRIAVLIFFILNWKFLLSKNRYSVIITKIYAFSILAFIGLSAIPVLAGRVSQLLGVVEVILVPYSLYIIKPKYVTVVLLVLFAMIIMYKQIYYSGLMGKYF